MCQRVSMATAVICKSICLMLTRNMLHNVKISGESIWLSKFLRMPYRT